MASQYFLFKENIDIYIYEKKKIVHANLILLYDFFLVSIF